MSTATKDGSTPYSDKLSSLANPQTLPVQQTGENDNDNGIFRPVDKCFTNTTEHSAVAIGFHFNGEADNCPYMLRRRFRFVGGDIILVFTDETLIIKGRNLGALYTDICRHKVDEIFVADYPEQDDKEPYIDSVIMKPTNEVKIDELFPKPER